MMTLWPEAHVSIGSNIGDRAANIDRAVALIASSGAVAAGGRVRRSSIFVSPPWGYESANEFYNQSIVFPTSLKPLQLHAMLQAIQRSIDPAPHRNDAGEYVDRTIDIDLIAVGDAVVDTPELELPHPRMHLRQFVLRPMAELRPDWMHPLLGRSVTQLLNEL